MRNQVIVFPYQLVDGEGNGNPRQCSCLETPVDRGAWWAAVHRVTQSRKRLKWLGMHASACWRIEVCWFSLWAEAWGRWISCSVGQNKNLFSSLEIHLSTCQTLWKNTFCIWRYFISFSWLSNIPLHPCTTSLSIPLLMDI